MAHRHVRRLLAASALTGCALGGAATTTATAAPADPVVRQLNAVRAEHGLRPLRVSAALRRTATAQSREIVAAGALSHASRRGSVGRRLRSASGATVVGEVLAFLPSASPASAVRTWLGSPAHRRLVLSPGFRRVGVGARAGTVGGVRGVAVTVDLSG